MDRKPRQYRFPCSDENSLLYGVNIGEYPVQHFIHPPWGKHSEHWPLQMTFSGPCEYIAGWWRERKNSDTFSLEWVRHGNFNFLQDANSYCCKPGDLFLVRRNSDSHMSCATAYAGKWTIGFDGGSACSVLDSLALGRTDLITQLPERPFAARFEALFRLAADPGERAARESSALLYQLLLELAGVNRKISGPDEIRKLEQYIDGHFSEPLTAEKMADIAGICLRTLFRKFRAATGRTPWEYLMERRMRQARLLLQEKRLSIKEVALSCGYRDPLYFSMDFKRRNGMSPSGYRNGH